MLSQITPNYKPIIIDSMYCFTDSQSRNIYRLMIERNKYKVAFTLTDSLYNDEVRKYKKNDSIKNSLEWENYYIDSLYNFQKKDILKLEKKVKRTRIIGFIAVIITLFLSLL